MNITQCGKSTWWAWFIPSQFQFSSYGRAGLTHVGGTIDTECSTDWVQTRHALMQLRH